MPEVLRVAGFRFFSSVAKEMNRDTFTSSKQSYAKFWLDPISLFAVFSLRE
ncbi:MAG: hypothetical protein WBX14_08095 [Candidatus Udaeobacter sp.]